MRATERFTVDGLRAACGSDRYNIVNISAGGMYLASPHPLPPGSRLVLDVEIDGRATIRVSGSVVWTNESTAPRAPHLPSGFGFQCQLVEIADRIKGH